MDKVQNAVRARLNPGQVLVSSAILNVPKYTKPSFKTWRLTFGSTSESSSSSSYTLRASRTGLKSLRMRVTGSRTI